jgi:hypothetical protein
MKKIILFSLLLSISFMFLGCPSSGTKKTTLPIYLRETKSVEEMSQIHNKFERFKYQIIGHFSNREQAEDNPGEAVQEFIVAPIFKDRPGEFWVYLEFFSPLMLDKPLDQRIEQYVQIDRDSFRMEVYYLKEPQKYINEWKKNKPFPNLDIRKDLIRDDNCDLVIVHQDDKPGTFRTLPPKEVSCRMLTPDHLAEYVDLSFELSDELYRMWFKFYNTDKKAMKETAEEGLLFRRLDPESEEYNNLALPQEE